jgi:hypothetical protein
VKADENGKSSFFLDEMSELADLQVTHDSGHDAVGHSQTARSK